MKTLDYYLSLASRGNADAAYEAAKIMHYEKRNEVIVQSMLRKAGKLGNPNAQRWLGLICLANQLIEPSSTVSNIKYVTDYQQAYLWFSRAAAQGDSLSAFAVCKCLQYGIGVDKDPEKSDRILNAISDTLNYDIIPVAFFFDAYAKKNSKAESKENADNYTTLFNELLVS